MDSKQIWIGIGALLLLLLNAPAALAQNSGKEWTVISNQTELTQLSWRDLESIFLGERELWKSGEQIIVVMPASQTAECQRIADLLFDGNLTSLQKHWLSIVFQGRSRPPVFLDREEEIIRYVQETPGAIAIVFSETPAGLYTWKIQ